MELQEYKRKRREQERTVSYRQVCYRCFRPEKTCFCKDITPLRTNFTFRLLMHPKEARKEPIGTGRLTNLALKNSRIIIGENFDDDACVRKLIHSHEYFPMLLYPGENSLNITENNFSTDLFQGRKPLLFILDGTWSCVKSMMRDSRSLQLLPRISFDSSVTSAFSIKQQPAKYCLSTIESVYQVLKNLEKQGIEKLNERAEILPAILQKIVEVQIQCASDPNLKDPKRNMVPFKQPIQRRDYKKWGSRTVCFEEKNYC